jgi:hypothetical protein
MGIAGSAPSGKNVGGMGPPHHVAPDGFRTSFNTMTQTAFTAGRDSMRDSMIEADGLCKYSGAFIAT